MNWGQQSFYWNPAPGAANYVVTVYDGNGNVVVSGNTTGTSLNLDTGTGNLTGGVNYTWQVAAQNSNGQTACRTPLVSIPRSAAPASVLQPPSSNTGGGGGGGVCNLLDPGVEYTNCPICGMYDSYDLVSCTYTCFTGC